MGSRGTSGLLISLAQSFELEIFRVMNVAHLVYAYIFTA